MKTALARRNEWMRQLRRLRENCDRHLEQQEPEGTFKSIAQPQKNQRRKMGKSRPRQ
jgi:hypothetical protein